MNIVLHIPKSARYTIGARIENKFLYLLELLHLAYFTEKDKPHRIGAEKNVVSRTGDTKDKLIVRIPMIARLRPVVVEPDPVRTARQVEDVRIAIGVGMYGAPPKSLLA